MTTWVPDDNVYAYITTTEQTELGVALGAATTQAEVDAAVAAFRDYADGHWGTVPEGL